MVKLKVCVVVDVEGFISLKQGNPRWNSFERFKGKINNIVKNMRYDKNGFDKVYSLIVKEQFPVSFMLVGSLFSPREKYSFIDYGYHTMNHLPLTLINNQKMNHEVKNIFNAKSFSAPLWMIEDIKSPGRIFNALRKEGYKIIIYKGKDDGIKCFHKDAIEHLIRKEGIICVHKSNDFQGNSSRKKMLMIIKEIEENRDREAVYCITTHDFVHKNLNNFKWLIKQLKEMENQGKIEITNLNRLIK